MLCRILPKKRKTGAVPVYLNVYDLTPINGYAYWLGLGVYHSGIQVHGIEYGFGAHDHSTTGIFEVEPKQCPGFTYRKSILVGRTDLGPKDVRSLMEKLSKDYSGNTYHLITKNCNHFCQDVSVQLTGKAIPSWVNRLARLGLLCKCVLPAGLSETKVRHVKVDDKHCAAAAAAQKKKLRRTNSSSSGRFETSSSSRTNTPTPPSTLSSACSTNSSSSKSGRRRQRRCIPTTTSAPAASSSSSSSSLVRSISDQPPPTLPSPSTSTTTTTSSTAIVV